MGNEPSALAISTDPASGMVPIIDLALLRSSLSAGDEAARRHMLDELAKACITCGVFYVRNHGIPGPLVELALSTASAFFSLPLEERMEIAVRPGEPCGYEPFDDSRELNDSFNCVFGMEEFPELDEVLATAQNRWPRRPGDLQPVIVETMQALYRVGVELMAALAQSLDLPAEHFADSIGSCDGSIRIRRYPPQANHTRRIGTDAHVDGPPLAIIMHNETPGLETEIPGVGWAAVPPLPGTLVCQLGELFKRWTNGRYVPNRHRVINRDPERDRLSIIYWFPIRPDALITCVPTCRGETDSPAPPPIRYGDYLAEWVRSFADEK